MSKEYIDFVLVVETVVNFRSAETRYHENRLRPSVPLFSAENEDVEWLQ